MVMNVICVMYFNDICYILESDCTVGEIPVKIKSRDGTVCKGFILGLLVIKLSEKI